MKKYIAAAIAATAILAGQAYAQPQCGPTDTVKDVLYEKYGEAIVMHGLTDSAVLLQVFVNPKTGSWTLVSSGADGTSCIAASGQAGEVFDYVSGDPA